MKILLYFKIENKKFVLSTNNILIKICKIEDNKVEKLTKDDYEFLRFIITIFIEKKLNYKILDKNNFEILKEFIPRKEREKLEEKSVTIPLDEETKKIFFDNCNTLKKGIKNSEEIKNKEKKEISDEYTEKETKKVEKENYNEYTEEEIKKIEKENYDEYTEEIKKIEKEDTEEYTKEEKNNNPLNNTQHKKTKNSKKRIKYKKIVGLILLVIILIVILSFINKTINQKNSLKKYQYEDKYNINIRKMKLKKFIEPNFYDSFAEFYIETTDFELLKTNIKNINNYKNENSTITITKYENSKIDDDFYNTIQEKDEEIKKVFIENNINSEYALTYEWLLNYSNKDKKSIIKRYTLNSNINGINEESEYIVFEGKKKIYAITNDVETTITLLVDDTIEIKFNKKLTDDEILNIASSIKYKNN